MRAAGLVGPQAFQAVQRIAPLIQKNPQLAGQLLALLGAVPVRAKGAPVTRRRRMAAALQRIDGVATQARDRRDASQDERLQAEQWLSRSAGLRSALELSAVGTRQQRQARLAQLQAGMDDLVAEMITVGLGDPDVKGAGALPSAYRAPTQD